MGKLILILHAPIAIFAATHALLYKRDPRASLSWMGLCLLLPLAGPFLYFVFGVNRVQQRARRLTGQKGGLSVLRHSGKEGSLAELSQYKIGQHTELEERYKDYTRVPDVLCVHPLSFGNSVKTLFNGNEAYPPMLQAIRSAKQHIYLMTYIFRPDSIGYEFIEALGDAKRRGVEVKVILDGVADWYHWPRASHLLKKQGVKVETHLNYSWFPPTIRINLRNHKKLLIVDGSHAFLGGMNITDINSFDSLDEPNAVQDIQFELKGPIIEQCYALFIEAWLFITGEEVTLPVIEYTPEGNMTCRALVDGPDEVFDKIELMMIAAIATAKKSVRIMTPYLLPSRDVISALYTASLRGIDVKIIVPKRSDNRMADYAAQNQYWELLQHGVKLYSQPSPFAHSKLFIADESYVFLGSANIDARSLRLNYELMLEVYDQSLAVELIQHFENVRIKSKDVHLSEVDGRGLITRIRDSICWLFLPYL